jgi:catalase (peroxidase I)
MFHQLSLQGMMASVDFIGGPQGSPTHQARPPPQTKEITVSTEAKCPFAGGARTQATARSGQTNADWWPNQLNLKILHQHSRSPTRWGRASTMPKAFKTLDLTRWSRTCTR